MKTTLYDFVLEHAHNNTAGGINFPDENLELDWQGLISRADAYASGLSSLGIGHESVVFLCGRNSSALLSSFLGAQRAGATPSILAPRMNGAADFIESLLLKMGRKKVRTGDPAEKSDRDVLGVVIDLDDSREHLVVDLRVTVQFLGMPQ